MITIKNKIPILEFFAFILFLLLFFGIAFSISTVIGIGFLSFLGFEYDSFKSVIFFFLLYFCIGGPVDFICISLLDIIRYVNKLPYVLYKSTEFILDVSITFIIVSTIDFFMNTITISSSTELLFAILSYAFSQCIDFIDNDKNKKTHS